MTLSVADQTNDSIKLRINGDKLSQKIENYVIIITMTGGKTSVRKIVTNPSQTVVDFQNLQPYTAYKFVGQESVGSIRGPPSIIENHKTLPSGKTIYSQNYCLLSKYYGNQ